MSFVVKTCFVFSLYLLCCGTSAQTFQTQEHANSWFKAFTQSLSPQQQYALLQQLPKGGDLHHHLSGSGYGRWWYEIATDEKINGGYRYYTRVNTSICNPTQLSTNNAPAFHTLSHYSYSLLSQCEQSRYKALSHLTEQEKHAFIASIELDKPNEGREEFFEFHWQRLNELTNNPYIIAQILLKNMQLYQKENLRYLETQMNMRHMKHPDGSDFPADDALHVITDMLAGSAAKETGVTVRFQYALIRFTDNIEEQLAWIFNFIDKHKQWYVGLNLVGREDDPRGHPLRFIKPLYALRAKYPDVHFAFHAGESEHADKNIRDTLLLGAKRIGHGINLLKDPDTYLLMRNSQFLVEINLISNLKLEYVKDLSEHPFPQLLRTGVPTALSTDDRGMWDATLTDEYYLAFTRFNLSWSELVTLSKNSLKYSFLDKQIKAELLKQLDSDLDAFLASLVSSEKFNTSHKPLDTESVAFSDFICEFEPPLCSQ